jgi:hypothetical protein
MSQIPREKTSEYYDYWTSENGRHWHQQWLQRHPLKEPKVSDQKSEEHKITFFHFWWNDLSLAGMKEAMVAEGIELGYQRYFSNFVHSKTPLTSVSEQCYGSRLRAWGLPTEREARRSFRREFEAHLGHFAALAGKIHLAHSLPGIFAEVLEHEGQFENNQSFPQPLQNIERNDDIFRGYPPNWQTPPDMNPAIPEQNLSDPSFHGYENLANPSQFPFSNRYSFAFDSTADGQNTMGFASLGQDSAYVYDANALSGMSHINISAGGSGNSNFLAEQIVSGLYHPLHSNSGTASSSSCTNNVPNSDFHSQVQTNPHLGGASSLMIGNGSANANGISSAQQISEGFDHEMHNIGHFEAEGGMGQTGIEDEPWCT